MARPTDHYIKDTSLAGQMRKFRHLGQMTDDEQLVEETRRAEALLAQDRDRNTFIVKDAQYKRATGFLKEQLEGNYIADKLAPRALQYRVVTYESGVLGISADATLRVQKDGQGNVIRDAKGKMMTIHGLLDQPTLNAAQAALYAETSVQPNLDLFTRLQTEYRQHVEEAFREGRPLFFTPQKKRDLTELL